MRRLLLLLIFSSLPLAAATAAQAIDPRVFMALQKAQQAQQKGDYAAARAALAGVEVKAESLEQAMLWRSQAYLAWAEGDAGKAAGLLEKVVAGGKLTPEQLREERANLARLSLAAGRHGRVVELLTPVPGDAGSEVLQMLVQAYQGLGQPAKALPLAERYVQANPKVEDDWLQFLVSLNADLKRYSAAERWQRQLLGRQPDDARRWRQLAALQQLAGEPHKALATLRAAHRKGVRFSAEELDQLVLLAGAAGQPWQGAKLLENLLGDGSLSRTATREERLGLLWWQARERTRAAAIYRELAQRSGSARHWLQVAQLELEQSHWRAGLDALAAAEKAGAERAKVRAWREWAQSQMAFDGAPSLARVN